MNIPAPQLISVPAHADYPRDLSPLGQSGKERPCTGPGLAGLCGAALAGEWHSGAFESAPTMGPGRQMQAVLGMAGAFDSREQSCPTRTLIPAVLTAAAWARKPGT